MGQLLLPIAVTALAAGTFLSYKSNKQAGKAAEATANFQAEQLQTNAVQQRGVSQKLAIEDKTNASLAASTATATAAAGGGASDVSNVRNIGRIAERGEYNALTDLYNGEEAARAGTTQAGVTKYEGAQAKKSYNTAAVGSVLGSVVTGGGLFAKYGGGGVNGGAAL